MNNDSVGKIIAFILMTITTMLAVLIILTRADSVVDSYITNVATSFVDTCRTTGKIEPDEYEIFCGNIYDAGDYSIEICHKQKMAYFDGSEARVDYKEVYTDDITSYMYDETEAPRAYQMNAGDVIKITVRKESGGLTNGILQFFMTSDGTVNILVNYSGTVGSNGAVVE